jgi:ferric-dicitrate binding protein FerR (iron transport regulator)
MNSENLLEIATKLIDDRLNPVEEDAVLTSPAVTEKMREQWDTAPDRAKSDKIDGSHIWKDIRRKTFRKIPTNKVRLYQFVAWAASLLLLLGVTGSAYFLFNKEKPASYYIVHSGILNISTVRLPDGTSVRLGSGSKLTYPTDFREGKREIWLDGQAFFDVTSDKEKPFVVHTAQMDVEALGTAFEIFTYAEDNFMEAILLNGKIKVSLADRKDTSFILMPDDKITYHKSDDKVILSQVDANNYTSWRRGILSFENEKLSMIIPRLEQWYGRKIFMDKELGEAYKFTFKVRDEPLERILYIMKESSPVRYKKSEDEEFVLFINK